MTTFDKDPAGFVPMKLGQSLPALLRERLKAAGAHEVAVYPAADHEGDPILVVEVKHRLVDRPITLKELTDADRAARDLAWQEGERRFVHIEHLYDEKQTVADAA